MQTMPRLYRWTRTDYERLAEQGAFMHTRVELIGGMIVEKAAKRPVHAVANTRLRWALERLFPRRRFIVRIQDPLALGAWDEPEPDGASDTGHRYTHRQEYRLGEQIAPLAAGARPVPVAELLP